MAVGHYLVNQSAGWDVDYYPLFGWFTLTHCQTPWLLDRYPLVTLLSHQASSFAVCELLADAARAGVPLRQRCRATRCFFCRERRVLEEREPMDQHRSTEMANDRCIHQHITGEDWEGNQQVGNMGNNNL